MRSGKFFPTSRKTYGAIYYPFFLHGVAGDSVLNQPDGFIRRPLAST